MLLMLLRMCCEVNVNGTKLVSCNIYIQRVPKSTTQPLWHFVSDLRTIYPVL